jgi:hypothetical protein
MAALPSVSESQIFRKELRDPALFAYDRDIQRAYDIEDLDERDEKLLALTAAYRESSEDCETKVPPIDSFNIKTFTPYDDESFFIERICTILERIGFVQFSHDPYDEGNVFFFDTGCNFEYKIKKLYFSEFREKFIDLAKTSHRLTLKETTSPITGDYDYQLTFGEPDKTFFRVVESS